jgi:hypothetical protein
MVKKDLKKILLRKLDRLKGEIMLNLYRFCGLLYVLSGAWCVFQSELASDFLGFVLDTASVQSEFFSVYGGLQTGLGLAMLLTSCRSGYVEAALYFSAIFSATLAIFRLLSFMLFGWHQAFIIMLFIEVMIAAALFAGWWRYRSVR